MLLIKCLHAAADLLNKEKVIATVDGAQSKFTIRHVGNTTAASWQGNSLTHWQKLKL